MDCVHTNPVHKCYESSYYKYQGVYEEQTLFHYFQQQVKHNVLVTMITVCMFIKKLGIAQLLSRVSKRVLGLRPIRSL